MITNPKTIRLAKIRKYIREAICWYKADDGMPGSWTRLIYNKTKKCKEKYHYKHKCYYYNRSSKAIEAIAEKIYELMNK